MFVCDNVLNGSKDQCSPSPGFDLGKSFADTGKLLYELTPIADIQHCADGTESCAWILANGPLKGLKVFDKLADAGKALPDEFVTAGKNSDDGVHVYFGTKDDKNVYVGITKDLGRRSDQHGGRFDMLEEVTTATVTRGQARAIEEALIVRAGGRAKDGGSVQNKIHSVSPNHPYYRAVVDWGETWLRANGL